MSVKHVLPRRYESIEGRRLSPVLYSLELSLQNFRSYCRNGPVARRRQLTAGSASHQHLVYKRRCGLVWEEDEVLLLSCGRDAATALSNQAPGQQGPGWILLATSRVYRMSTNECYYPRSPFRVKLFTQNKTLSVSYFRFGQYLRSRQLYPMVSPRVGV